jgi:hypothetical protein
MRPSFSSREDKGMKVFLLHPMHVRTRGVANKNEVTEHRTETLMSPSLEIGRRLTPLVPINTCRRCNVLKWNITLAGWAFLTHSVMRFI